MNVIDRDAARPKIARDALDKSLQSGLTHCIDGASDKGHSLGIRAANIDDPASFHVLDCGVGCDRRLAFDRDTDVHSVRAVLVYKFGRPEAPVPIK